MQIMNEGRRVRMDHGIDDGVQRTRVGLTGVADEDEGGAESAQDPNVMNFTLFTKRGNKQQVCSHNAPHWDGY